MSKSELPGLTAVLWLLRMFCECLVTMTLIKHVCLGFLMEFLLEDRSLTWQAVYLFHQCGQTKECASKLECINKLFSCLSFFFFSCLCSFFRWLSRLLTRKSWEDLHHKWPMTMGIWLSRAEWLQLQQNQRRSAVFRPLYSLYTVAPTWVFFYCREYNNYRVKWQGVFTLLGCSNTHAAIAKCDTSLVWSNR